MAWPEHLRINAWLGEEPRAASGALAANAGRWPLRNKPLEVRPRLKPPPPVDPRNWRHSSVGWGIVARDGVTLPEPLEQLRKDRGDAPVLRYLPDSDQRFRLLRKTAAGADLAIGQSPTGLGREAIPRYLLIYGGPDEVPWELQYVLNAWYAVGRLALSGEALENYIAFLRCEWKEPATARTSNALVWAVDQGGEDITALMRDVVASKVYDRIAADPDLKGSTFLDGREQATARNLIAALASQKPGLIVTTSHGQTYPLDNVETLGRSLGLLVDQNFATVGIEALLSGWQPDGAVWYAHACCSAGAVAHTIFEGLVEEGSEVDRVLRGVAAVRDRVAPLPTALLGAKKPLRAFIGHVEPTFDWTLLSSDTNQSLTDSLQRALYDELYQPSPVGYAFRACYERLGSLYTAYDQDQREFSRGGNTRDAMLKDLLCARDVQSTVILGDPVVSLG